MTVTIRNPDGARELRRRLWLLMVLSAAHTEGITPIRTQQLHAFAYLADILSPVWGLERPEQWVLKRRRGPYYPQLQRELDRLLGLGFVQIDNLVFVTDAADERCVMEGSYTLQKEGPRPILDYISRWSDFTSNGRFLRSLAAAIASLAPNEFQDSITKEATYGLNTISENMLIDFTDPEKNFTAKSAETFQDFVPSGLKLSPGEKLHLYAQYLHRLSNAA